MQVPAPPVRRTRATIRECVCSCGRASPVTAPWPPTGGPSAMTVSARLQALIWLSDLASHSIHFRSFGLMNFSRRSCHYLSKTAFVVVFLLNGASVLAKIPSPVQWSGQVGLHLLQSRLEYLRGLCKSLLKCAVMQCCFKIGHCAAITPWGVFPG